MAGVLSLGTHSPSALPYLIAEKFLPPEPKQSLYEWTLYSSHGGNSEEEILTTQSCVVWSQDGFIRKVFTFSRPGQKVRSAILTSFAQKPTTKRDRTGVPPDLSPPQNSTEHISRIESVSRPRSDASETRGHREPTQVQSRALAIFLEKEVQIHFLHGPSHVLSLPFEIEKAYPALQGLVVQRKHESIQQVLPSPLMPPAPQNSFLSSQSHLAPRGKISGQRGSQVAEPPLPSLKTPRSGASLMSMFQSPLRDDDDDLPHLYSLKDPLSGFCPFSHASLAYQPQRSRSSAPDILVEYDDLPRSERMIYISKTDELTGAQQESSVPLVLMVTLNVELRQATVWQGWYLESLPLKSLVLQRATLKAARAKRRGSFVSSVTVTGAATPVPRHRDKARESYAAAARLPLDQTVQHKHRPRTDSKPSQDDEEAMASQMDPEFRTSQTAGKSTRRVSSLLSRADLATTDARGHVGPSASFGAPGRRGPSFGASYERRSLGTSTYRRSRGSTPGSIFSRSIGPDDDLMDIEGLLQGEDVRADMLEVQQLFEATSKATSIESVLGSAAEGAKQDFVVRKVHSIPLDIAPLLVSKSFTDIQALFEVATLCKTSGRGVTSHTMTVHVHNKAADQVSVLTFKIDKRTPAASLPVPVLESLDIVSQCKDITTIRQKNVTAILHSYHKGNLQVYPCHSSPWSYNLPQSLRVHDPTDSRSALGRTKRDVGKARTVETPENFHRLQTSGRPGEIDISGPDGIKYRLQLVLRPQNDDIFRVLNICQYVLGEDLGGCVHQLWNQMHTLLQTERLGSSYSDEAEWESLIMTLFSFCVGSIGPNSIEVRKPSRSNPQRLSQHHSSRVSRTDNKQYENSLPKAKPASWAWMGMTRPQAVAASPSSSSRRKTARPLTVDRIASHSMIEMEARCRHLLHRIAVGELKWLISPASAQLRHTCTLKILLAVHLAREEMKLTTMKDTRGDYGVHHLAAGLAQIGGWLGMEAWDWRPGNYYEIEGATYDWDFSNSPVPTSHKPLDDMPSIPPSIFEWLEQAFTKGSLSSFPSLGSVAGLGRDGAGAIELPDSVDRVAAFLPRSSSLVRLVARLSQLQPQPVKIVEALHDCGLSSKVLETLPEAVTAPLRVAIESCQSNPPSIWSSELLLTTGREDLVTALSLRNRGMRHENQIMQTVAPHDISSTFALAERGPLLAKTHEADRHTIISLIFTEDRRFMDVKRLTNPSLPQVAECPPQPEWSEVEHLDQQKRVMQWVMHRTLALPPGNAMVHFESQQPLVSEKFHVPGFTTLCQMKPMDNTISADRSGLTEEKHSWAFFHAGVSAGLHISKKAKGIDTSWIVFNKPAELTNRHAGFLFALGLNGHLRFLAKWLAFKYLTPKHTMTSVGLLLGLSASYIGTMDSLITRMLSVHITRMLPPGAAELNVSSSTQTAGLMGIGLLYYNTQHRRMSEIMLSELEHREIEDSGSTTDLLRDESYRLAAGLALGFINLGQGVSLQGLHGMGLLERLLSVAVGPRPVELVHVVDKATAGAVIAIALVYMKSGDRAVARKIDVPATFAQLDHVRPDVLMLRTLAKNLILWDEISDEPGWIQKNLPAECAARYFAGRDGKDLEHPFKIQRLKSDDVPFFNILTGLAWALSLKFAGNGNENARDEVLSYLKLFTALSKQEAYYYDAMLARNTVRRCIDVMALAAATIMAGTGDLETFRYLRRLHGRTDATTTYGSHLAAHLAIGTLFLGGGTYTFGTSNLAIASLVCAQYPLWPSDVLDNVVHLQALRHLWVFAAEPRCIVVEDIDTQRPLAFKLQLTLRDGTIKSIRSPCLLPEIHTIASIRTDDTGYWPVTLDFVANPAHLFSFRTTQILYVRRAPPQEASPLTFSTTLTALNEAQNTPGWRQFWDWILKLPAFRDFEDADLGLVLPPTSRSNIHLDEKGTVVDDRLVLAKSARMHGRDDLWNLRLLFNWAEEAKRKGDGRLRWVGQEFVEKLRGHIEDVSRTK